jgi:hypothetical protein
MSDEPKTWDLFICHASEDKEELVRPLALLLREFGLEVWFDEFSLKAGDSLSAAIDRGLANSKFGVVIVSTAFLAKGWPQREMAGLVTREVSQYPRQLIIPIWHGVSSAEVRAASPTLADKHALNTSNLSIAQLALGLINVIRPELIRLRLARRAVEEAMSTAKVELVNLKDLKAGPIQHEQLPKALEVRIGIFQRVLSPYVSMSLEETIDNFRRDLNPEEQVESWERLTEGVLEAMEGVESDEERQRIFRLLFTAWTGAPDPSAPREAK